MAIKKTSAPRSLPPINPALRDKIAEAERAEARGDTPLQPNKSQKITREPPPYATDAARKAQYKAVGLVENKHRTENPGLLALAKQKPFRPEEDLDDIWDSLSEKEKKQDAGATHRFRLEFESTLEALRVGFAPPHSLGGILNRRALDRALENIKAEIDASASALAPDAHALLLRFANETTECLAECLSANDLQGVDAVTGEMFLSDLCRKLMYQELVSRSRRRGDRGIRRICANIDLAEQLYHHVKALPVYSPRMRLMMRVIHAHQGLGYTAYAARTSYRGGLLQRTYASQIVVDEGDRLGRIFAPKEISLLRAAIATISDAALPYAETLIIAFARTVEHLALFGPHRLLNRLDEGSAEHQAFTACAAHTMDTSNLEGTFENIRAEVYNTLDASALDEPIREDLKAGLRPFEDGVPLWSLGASGTVSRLELDVSGAAAVKAIIEPDANSAQLHPIFDHQQEAFRRVLAATNIELSEFRPGNDVTLQTPGSGALVLSFG